MPFPFLDSNKRRLPLPRLNYKTQNNPEKSSEEEEEEEETGEVDVKSTLMNMHTVFATSVAKLHITSNKKLQRWFS